MLLGSATPSLESWRNAQLGRYTRLVMTNRVEGRPMPVVEVIDLRHEKGFLGGLSETLRQAMHQALGGKGAGHPAAEPAGLSHVRRLPELRARGQVPRL